MVVAEILIGMYFAITLMKQAEQGCALTYFTIHAGVLIALCANTG